MTRGTVQRMQHPKEGLPYIEHRTRDLQALFADAEWGWSLDGHDAYVFEAYGLPDFPGNQTPEFSATVHVEALIKAGEKCRVWACTFGVEQEQKRIRRRAEQEHTTLQSVRAAGFRVAPEEAYEMTRQHLGERD